MPLGILQPHCEGKTHFEPLSSINPGLHAHPGTFGNEQFFEAEGFAQEFGHPVIEGLNNEFD